MAKKKKTYEVEMFKSGSQTDSSGTEKVWTNDDLDNIVKTYNESNNDAPVVVGHPKHNSPAFGMIKSVKRTGDKLVGILRDMNEDFVEAWKDGAFPKRSISMKANGEIRHIGFLGGVAPAVKGLADYQFSEADDEETLHEFSDSFDYMEWEEASLFRQIGRIFQRQREQIIDKQSVKVADEIIPIHVIDDLKSTEATPSADLVKSFSEPIIKGGLPMAMTPEEKQSYDDALLKVATLEGEALSFSESLSAKDTTITTLKADASKIVIAGVTAEFNEFCGGLIKTGHMKPADKDAAVKQLLVAHNVDGTTEFSEGESSEKDGAVAFLKSTLSNVAQIVNFKEHVENEDDIKDLENDPNAIVEKANDYMESQRKDGKIVMYNDAVNAVVSGKAK